MNIGILKEIKPSEYRIPLVPQGVRKLMERGHGVIIQSGAGDGAGYPDETFNGIGARIAPDADTVTRAADLIVKVKEPIPEEFDRFREGQALFCFLHSETRPSLVDMLLDRKMTAVAFENVLLDDGARPLLAPMSIIAGQQAVLQGMAFLCNHRGGVGTSLVAYPGLAPAEVVILGAGQAGFHAATVAAGLGAQVSLFEIDGKRIGRIAPLLPANVRVLSIETVPLRSYLETADMVIHATTVPPDSARHIIDRKALSHMKTGCVIVDVSANLGGAIETVDRYTTHTDPVWTVDGIVHYAVTNIPGTVARTASAALSLAVLPFLTELADRGVVDALKENAALRRGLTAHNGRLTWREAGEYQDRPWISPDAAVFD